MPNYNKVILIGHITKDLELKYSNDGMPICSFNIAVNNGYGDKREAVFIQVTAFKKTAENINEYCKKGDAILVDGYIKQENWEEKDTGKKRSKLVVIANTVQFMNSKKDGTDESKDAGEPVKDNDISF